MPRLSVPLHEQFASVDRAVRGADAAPDATALRKRSRFDWLVFCIIAVVIVLVATEVATAFRLNALLAN
jgi:hypothetical protein